MGEWWYTGTTGTTMRSLCFVNLPLDLVAVHADASRARILDERRSCLAEARAKLAVEVERWRPSIWRTLFSDANPSRDEIERIVMDDERRRYKGFPELYKDTIAYSFVEAGNRGAHTLALSERILKIPRAPGREILISIEEWERLAYGHLP